MNLKDLDLKKLSKLTSQQIYHVTCLECCKYYIAPATAACGHTLCHSCWRGRRSCPACTAHLDRKTLKLNVPLQTLTDHIHVLGEAFEKLFNIKLDEFNRDIPDEIEQDPDKYVKDWLTSSQNHFSAPIQSSQTFSQDLLQPPNPIEISAGNIIIHTDSKKAASPPKVIHVPPPQDDWDKIEHIPDPEETNKKKENIIGPMDIEQFFVEDSEYTNDNPRRSSRKREKNDDSRAKAHDLSSNVHSSRDSSGDNDKKSQKTKQTWNSVKRMRKEFSKLNKKNRSKLNVSIEMVKKTQNVKPTINTPVIIEPAFNIDDNTPDNTNKENNILISNLNQPTGNDQLANVKPSTPLLPLQKEKSNSNSIKEAVVDSQNILPNDIIVDKDKNKKINEVDSLKDSENPTIKQLEQPELTKMPFIKKSALNPTRAVNPDIIHNHCNKDPSTSENSDDIEISIKIGNTITNIVIKQKSDVQVKVKTDREVQTSLGPHSLVQNNETSEKDVNTHNVDIVIENTGSKGCNPVTNMNHNKNLHTDTNLDKSTSGKKHTASDDTATAQFEITESVEKELSNIMECDNKQINKDKPKSLKSAADQQIKEQNTHKIVKEYDNVEDLNDLDIFNSGSVKEANVHSLKEHAPSEIFISTVQSKFRTQKRNRDNNDEDTLPELKKSKTNKDQMSNKKGTQAENSEPINYDAFMGQVFANIDADIEDIKKSQEVESISILNDTEKLKNNHEANKNTQQSSQTQKTQIVKTVLEQQTEVTPHLNEYFNEKHSENVFSILEKEDEISQIGKVDKVPQPVEDLLTPLLVHNISSTQESLDKVNKNYKKTQDYDDSDKSVVEETPQKNISFPKLKRASTSNQSQMNLSETKKISLRKSTSNVKSIINLTDTVDINKSSRDVTVIETAAQKITLETPLTITKFANQIKHKSTPMARKSLNFENENDDDPEQTLCPTSEGIAKTTQEKEFLIKAFERTPTTPAARPLKARNVGLNTNKKYCLAGSCLTSSEIAKVKLLCNERKWSYVDKYTKDITHLIVGVDDEKKSQRSVKYMCALAASKWIVSFEWIKICLQCKDVVSEDYYEVLDSTGEPGPRRSRIAKQKLFEGILFYCMPPFSVLNVDTLTNMLVAAGGLVMNEARCVKVTDDTTHPALLLAEPENTQEDRFIYLAMEQSIVPVNYEWVLNCLGNYTLGSIQELLLCPSSLLPAATAKWPEVLLSQDYD